MNEPQTMTDAILARRKIDLERLHVAAEVRRDREFRRCVLGELRLAYRRAYLHMQAIKEAAKMIRDGVDPELALSMIGDAMDYVIPMPPQQQQQQQEKIYDVE